MGVAGFWVSQNRNLRNLAGQPASSSFMLDTEKLNSTSLFRSDTGFGAVHWSNATHL